MSSKMSNKSWFLTVYIRIAVTLLLSGIQKKRSLPFRDRQPNQSLNTAINSLEWAAKQQGAVACLCIEVENTKQSKQQWLVPIT